MRKLVIDDLFRPIKKQVRNPLFYYKYFINYGEIFEDPLPRLELGKALLKMRSVDKEAGKIAYDLSNHLGGFDIKNLFHHVEYRKNYFKNYIPSKPLLEVLSKIKVDTSCASLPTGYRAYFDLAGYKNLQYSLISIVVKPDGGRYIKITVCGHDISKDCMYFGVDLSDDTLEGQILKIPFVSPKWNGSKYEMVSDTPTTEISELINLLANLVIYTSNPNEDFKEQYNQFSKDNKKAQREKLEYTSRPFTPIGEGIEFLRLIREEEVGVVGHFRWQPCGVGRTQRKLTFVKPHVRTYKKFEGDSVEN